MTQHKTRDARPIVWGVVALVIAIGVYAYLLGERGIKLLFTGTPTGIGLGLGMIGIPLLGGWIVYASLRAGLDHQRLARSAAEQGRELDVSDLPRRPSGRIEPDAADALFAQVKVEFEADPTDWRNTYRIARAYDYAGDRKRAREMMKRAVEQYRTDPRGELE